MTLPQILIPTAVAAAGASTFAAYAGLSYTSQIFGRTLVAPPLPHQIALTFDDGPNPSATPQLLEVLARHNVRATFFLIGDFVLSQPALTREILAGGHTIGNHTMHHPWLARHSEATIREELLGCNRALEDTLGAPVTLFRPPHGARRPAVMRIARELGLETVQWNVMVGDWLPRSAENLLPRLERGIASNQRHGRGSNIVLHDGSQHGLGAPRMPSVGAVALLLSRLPKETAIVTPPHWR